MTNNKEKIIDLFYNKRLKPTDIALKLNVSNSYVTKVIKNDSRYYEEKDKRKKQNRIKHNEQTKEYMRSKRENSKRRNNKDNLDLKSMHNQAVAELSQKRRLTNMNYRDWNKSAFIYNEKRKGYEFKKELGRSYDVPKFIKVEV